MTFRSHAYDRRFHWPDYSTKAHPADTPANRLAGALACEVWLRRLDSAHPRYPEMSRRDLIEIQNRLLAIYEQLPEREQIKSNENDVAVVGTLHSCFGRIEQLRELLRDTEVWPEAEELKARWDSKD